MQIMQSAILSKFAFLTIRYHLKAHGYDLSVEIDTLQVLFMISVVGVLLAMNIRFWSLEQDILS